MTRLLFVSVAIALLAGCQNEARPAEPSAAHETAGDHPQQRRQAAPADTSDAGAATGGATLEAAHPGTIVFVDVDGREDPRSAADVPDSIAWVEVDGEHQPVVRIVQRAAGDRVEITRYGADGRILDRTTGSGSPRPHR